MNFDRDNIEEETFEEIHEDVDNIDYFKRENFSLADYQQEVADELIRRFLTTEFKVQLLPAMTGYGKTFVTIYIALQFWTKYKIKPLVICPATVSHMWKKALNGMEIPYLDIFSYQLLSGQKGKLLSGISGTPSEVRAEPVLKHGLLIRGNEDRGPFKPTIKWEGYLNRGVFLIFDEPHMLKNDTSAVHHAARVLIASALGAEGMFFGCLHLSAAMLDGDKIPFFRSMGLMLRKEPYVQNPGLGLLQWKKHGFGTVYDSACKLDKAKTHAIMKKYVGIDTTGKDHDHRFRLRSDRFQEMLTELWTEIFRAQCAASVTDPVYLDENGTPFKNEMINGFYELEEEDAEKAAAAMRKLKTGGVMNDDGQVNTKAKDAMKLIQSALASLCEAKRSGVLKQTIASLRENPTCKIILAIPFIKDQDWLAKHLMLYNPLILRGTVKDIEQRHKIIDDFNAPNLKHRVIIMTPTVGGVGVSLHDHKIPSDEDMKGLPMFKTKKEAVFPRITYMIFNFHFLTMFQCAGRAYRRGMRSDNKVICFYASNAPLESVLVNTMIKSGNANSIAPPGTGRKFPDQYDIFIENEGPEHQYLRRIMERMRQMTPEELKKNKKKL